MNSQATPTAPENRRRRNHAICLGVDLRLLSDPDLKVIDAFGVRHPGAGMGEDVARPATFIVDRQGVVRFRHLTDNFRIRPRPERIVEQLRRIP